MNSTKNISAEMHYWKRIVQNLRFYLNSGPSVHFLRQYISKFLTSVHTSSRSESTFLDRKIDILQWPAVFVSISSFIFPFPFIFSFLSKSQDSM